MLAPLPARKGKEEGRGPSARKAAVLGVPGDLLSGWSRASVLGASRPVGGEHEGRGKGENALPLVDGTGARLPVHHRPPGEDNTQQDHTLPAAA